MITLPIPVYLLICLACLLLGFVYGVIEGVIAERRSSYPKNPVPPPDAERHQILGDLARREVAEGTYDLVYDPSEEE